MKRRLPPQSVMDNRPNKVAKGMTKTSHNQRKKDWIRLPFEDAERIRLSTLTKLMVHGTTDRLTGGIRFYITRKQESCPCCGSTTGRLKLNDRGREKLKRLKGIS